MTTELTSLAKEISAFINDCADGKASDFRFNDLALRLFCLQFQHNAPYGKFCRHLGTTPASIQSWEQIPPIVTPAFKELDLTVLPPTERKIIFHSSGTTEQKPSRHFHNSTSAALYELSLLTWFKPHFLPDQRRARFLFLTPPPAQAPHSSLVHMFSTIGCDLASDYTFASQADPSGAWHLDDGIVKDFPRASSEPVIICGTAFSFVHLHDALAGEKVPIPAASKILETGGYKGRSRELSKPALRKLIADIFSIPPGQILSEYGMSELSSQAYDSLPIETGVGAFAFPRWARARVISPETGAEVADGDSGLLRVFDLANLASVVAIQTEDLAIRRGPGFEIIGRASSAEARGCSLMAA